MIQNVFELGKNLSKSNLKLLIDFVFFFYFHSDIGLFIHVLAIHGLPGEILLNYIYDRLIIGWHPFFKIILLNNKTKVKCFNLQINW